MKNIVSFIIVALVFMNIPLVSAEMGGDTTKYMSQEKTYTTAEAFLKAEGNTCEVATDGCNTIMIQDGQFGASTLMACQGEPKYSCQKQKEVEEVRMCTAEYAPVCGVDGVTYGNACSAGKTKIVNQGECKSYVDQALYAKIVANTKSVKKVESVLEKISMAQLDSAVVNIEERIKMVKMSRIVESVQIKRITILTFLLDKIQMEMNLRNEA